MSEIIQGFQTENGIAKYDYNALENKTHWSEEQKVYLNDFYIDEEGLGMASDIILDCEIGSTISLTLIEEDHRETTEFVWTEIEEDGVKFPCFGNTPKLLGTGDNGVPFVAIYVAPGRQEFNDFQGLLVICFEISSQTFNFEIDAEKVHKIPTKFLPIAGLEKVEEEVLLCEFQMENSSGAIAEIPLQHVFLNETYIVYLGEDRYECKLNAAYDPNVSGSCILLYLGMTKIWLALTSTPSEPIDVKIYTKYTYRAIQPQYFAAPYFSENAKKDSQAELLWVNGLNVFQENQPGPLRKVLYTQVDTMDSMSGASWLIDRDKIQYDRDYQPLRKVALLHNNETSNETIPAFETTIEPGQIVKAKAINRYPGTSGKYVEWECVDPWIIQSSTEGSTKKFKITVDDSGNLSTTEIV